MCCLREAEKKVLLLMAGPLRGGGVKGRAKGKNNFFSPNVLINGPTIKRRIFEFFVASLWEAAKIRKFFLNGSAELNSTTQL